MHPPSTQPPGGPSSDDAHPGAADVRRATTRAAAAFAAEQRERSFSDAALLRAIADGLEAGAEELTALALEETGLGAPRIAGEIARTTGQLRAFAGVAESGSELEPIIDLPAPSAIPPRPDQRRVNVPIGPIAVFAASNFPFAFGIAGGDTAAAFAAGCPVVAKAHPAQPATSTAIAAIVSAAVRSAGAPDAWFALVEGDDGLLVGQLLAAAEEIEAIAFTGSYGAGLALARTAALRERPIPVFAEMGSVNPLLVTPRAAAARGDAIAEGLAASIVQSAGQLCTKPGLIALVDDAAGQALVARVAELLAATPPALMLTTGLRDRFAEGLAEHSGDPRVRVRVASQPDERPGWQATGLLEARADALRPADPLLEELFGPAALVVWCAGEDELLALAGERLPGTLTATLHAEPGELLAARLAPLLAARAGRVVFDGYPTGVTVGWATMHGGPFPATTAPAHTSVGMTASRRFLRPAGYQGFPDALLPAALRDENPLGLTRRVDGALTSAAIVRADHHEE